MSDLKRALHTLLLDLDDVNAQEEVTRQIRRRRATKQDLDLHLVQELQWLLKSSLERKHLTGLKLVYSVSSIQRRINLTVDVVEYNVCEVHGWILNTYVDKKFNFDDCAKVFDSLLDNIE